MIGKSIAFITLSVLITLVVAERLFPGNPYSHRQSLDPEGKYLLEWIADPRNSDVIFNITAQTKGYVALGFSKTGKMSRSDIVVAGVRPNGQPYISDRHTNDGRIPIIDTQQDWKVVKAWENKTHTSIRIIRDMETCDPQDFPINDDTMHLIWAYGEDDVLDYHFKNRGSFQANILQLELVPMLPPGAKNVTPGGTPQGIDVWRLSVGIDKNVSSIHNGHSWCIFQKGPELDKKHYIIGFSTPNNDGVRLHLDRLVAYRCSPDVPEAAQLSKTTDRTFAELIDYSGECRNATELFAYCKDIIYTWGKGGKEIFLPKETGIPFGTDPDEYYLLESYLHNRTENLTEKQQELYAREREINVDIDFLLTETPRKHEARILKVGHNPMTPLIIPPGALEFEVFGHCVDDCTEKRIPRQKPMQVFGVSFDTGLAGKSVTLHQVRNAQQVPTVVRDGNHDPTFQQMLVLREETPVRNGDQLTVQCTFDSTFRSGVSSPKLVIDPSKSTERCIAYLWYYDDMNRNSSEKRPSYPECTSVIHPGDFAKWITEKTPKELRNATRNADPQQILSRLNTLKWTPRMRHSLYQLYKLGRYRTSCGSKHGEVLNIAMSSANGTSKNNTFVASRTNGTTRKFPSAAPADLTVFPIPVEEIPYTVNCPRLAETPVLFGLPGPVILGFR